MTTTERVQALAEPVCAAEGVELVDVEMDAGVLRVTVDRDGGLDLDVISTLTRRLSRLLDDEDPVPGRYTLEVSSPGLERRLRTPAHFRRAVGEQVSLRTAPGTEAGRRLRGALVAADDDGVTVRVGEGDDAPTHTIRHDQIERARTVFEWGPAPRPGGPKPPTPPSARKKATKP
ncbi:MAG TPA: ribosome maturation factor RimP [Acidimicrobiales bacterium]|nr:ribosome maturation factor RimP [Acidimicrobiales bacterium]